MKTENNLGLNWLQVLQFPSAEFQHRKCFLHRKRFLIQSQLCQDPHDSHTAELWIWKSHHLEPSPHQLLCCEPSGSGNPKNPSSRQDFPCGHERAASSSQVHSQVPRLSMIWEKQFPVPPYPPSLGCRGGLVGFFFDWIQVRTFKFKSFQVQEIS